MENRSQKTKSPAITLGDILFALFKYKWIILAFSLLGIGGGAAIFLARKPIYESQVRLLVRYVIDSNPLDGVESKIDLSSRAADSVMQAEIAILTSWDLVTETVGSIGAKRLLPDADEKGIESAAAASILENMQVSVARGGNVLNVGYTNEDPVVAREVLVELVKRYLDKHLEVHRGGGDFDLVTVQTEQVRTQLRRTEDELKTKKMEAGIMSLDDAISSTEAQRAKVNDELFAAELALAGQEARVKAFEALLGIEGAGGESEEGGKADGKDASGPGAGPDKTGSPDPGAAVAANAPAATGVHLATKYQTLTTQLAFLEKRQYELELKFRGGRLLELNGEEKARLQAELDELIKAHPSLMGMAGADSLTGANPAEGAGFVAMQADLMAFQARTKMLQEQKALVEENFNKIALISPEIASLESRRKAEEENYQTAQTSLGKARIDDALDSTKIPNISYIQRPSAPAKRYHPTATKLAGAAAAGGVLLGVALALLLELVVDHRVKRPIELESRFRIPLMMSIPHIGMLGRIKLVVPPSGQTESAGEGAGSVLAPSPSGSAPNPLVHGCHFINPYADTVRDRLGYYFELNNMTHKPKLIALTGLSEGAGTSTLAAGLAAAFAEIEDSKVLFIDMNSLQLGDSDAFEWKKAKSAGEKGRPGQDPGLKAPGDNLYVATIPARSGGAGSKRLASKKFYDLMPKFRSSQFDYIIFDMPPLGPTSPTTAMAGFMDQVILVLDAQNTDRNLLQQGYAELSRGSADVTCIFNKARSLAPRWIQGAA